MKTSRLILPLTILTLFLNGCAGTSESGKNGWEIPQIKKWYADYRTLPDAWPGILYQGSDSDAHHFIARQFDNWVFIKIRKSNLTLAEELPIQHTSNTLGYYFVDPLNQFQKINASR